MLLESCLRLSKDSPNKSKASAPPIEEEEEELSIEEDFTGDKLVDETDNVTEGNTEIDFATDLD